MRVFAAVSTLFIVIFYLIAQMVGAGQLVELLFGLDYVYAEIAVGLLMVRLRDLRRHEWRQPGCRSSRPC